MNPWPHQTRNHKWKITFPYNTKTLQTTFLDKLFYRSKTVYGYIMFIQLNHTINTSHNCTTQKIIKWNVTIFYNIKMSLAIFICQFFYISRNIFTCTMFALSNHVAIKFHTAVVRCPTQFPITERCFMFDAWNCSQTFSVQTTRETERFQQSVAVRG